MDEVLQNGNYQREANANMSAVETRKEVKNSPRWLASASHRIGLARIDTSLYSLHSTPTAVRLFEARRASLSSSLYSLSLFGSEGSAHPSTLAGVNPSGSIKGRKRSDASTAIDPVLIKSGRMCVARRASKHRAAFLNSRVRGSLSRSLSPPTSNLPFNVIGV